MELNPGTKSAKDTTQCEILWTSVDGLGTTILGVTCGNPAWSTIHRPYDYDTKDLVL